MEYQKVKSASKEIVTKGPRLKGLVSETMRTIAEIVGATLGPGGQPVLIERFEHGLPVTVTKDGVTVFRALGFKDPVKQCIMESARDAAIRTASEAGDGTTTATILADALVRGIFDYVDANPSRSPQLIVREIESTFREKIEPQIKGYGRVVSLDDEDGYARLLDVATISANGDKDLAKAVMKCFDICGDEGNVTITEVSGPSRYEVEHIKGYPMYMGYEESCGKFYPKFLNSVRTQQCVLENPVFICYHGRITDTGKLLPLMRQIGAAWDSPEKYPNNIVIAAIGFSEQVIADLAYNFARGDTINVFPLIVPQSPIHNGQLHFLDDLCAITNGDLFDPISAPLETVTLDRLGNVAFDESLGIWRTQGVTLFEAGRFRSSLLGHADEEALFERIADLKALNAKPESIQDDIFMKERIAKLSGGIARLKVVGSSNGELKEKRDRAEDAVCAVRGAIKHGYLPGGGWTLVRVIAELDMNFSVNRDILIPAFKAPIYKLLDNAGETNPDGVILTMGTGPDDTFNILTREWVDAYDGGVYDSLPAVLESIRNSISIASNLGTLGGCVVFGRDTELERTEASNTAQFNRDVSDESEADKRA